MNYAGGPKCLWYQKNEIPTGAKKQHKMYEWRDFEMMTLMLHDNLNGGWWKASQLKVLNFSMMIPTVDIYSYRFIAVPSN